MRLVTIAAILALVAWPAVAGDRQLERIVTRHVRSIVPPDGAGGVAVALRIEGRTLFFNYGLADRAANRPITADTLFNLASLRKVFETTLLAQAVRNGELGLDDPAAKYVVELQRGGHIRQVTLGQLATHTSGLLLPQDHPPWPDWGYTLPEFIRTLNAWTYYHWPGTGQMYSSPRDMAAFLAANLDQLPVDQSLRDAIALAHRNVFRIGPRNWQALAWETTSGKEPTIIEKYGGLNNASAYIGMMPSRKLGIVILGNRGDQYPNECGRQILLELAADRE